MGGCPYMFYLFRASHRHQHEHHYSLSGFLRARRDSMGRSEVLQQIAIHVGDQSKGGVTWANGD